MADRGKPSSRARIYRACRSELPNRNRRAAVLSSTTARRTIGQDVVFLSGAVRAAADHSRLARRNNARVKKALAFPSKARRRRIGNAPPSIAWSLTPFRLRPGRSSRESIPIRPFARRLSGALKTPNNFFGGQHSRSTSWFSSGFHAIALWVQNDPTIGGTTSARVFLQVPGVACLGAPAAASACWASSWGFGRRAYPLTVRPQRGAAPVRSASRPMRDPSGLAGPD